MGASWASSRSRARVIRQSVKAEDYEDVEQPV
jgi:hypothetical protein